MAIGSIWAEIWDETIWDTAIWSQDPVVPTDPDYGLMTGDMATNVMAIDTYSITPF